MRYPPHGCVALALVCLTNLGWTRAPISNPTKGQQSTYSFSLFTYGKAQVIELKQRPNEYRSQLSGDLVMAGKVGAGALYGTIKIRSLSLTSGPDRLEAEERLLRTALGKPFVVHRQDGKFTGCGFQAEVPPEARKMVRTVLSIAQLPGAGHLATHKLVLDDAVGTKSLRVNHVGRGIVELTDKKYVTNTSTALKLKLTGTWSAKVSPNNLLGFDEVHGQESLDAQVTKLSHSSARLQAEIRHTSTSFVGRSELASLLASSAPAQPLWVRPTELEVRRSLALHTLHGLCAADVFRIVEQLGTKDQSDQSGTDAFSKLRALAIVSDDATREVGRRLMTAPVETPQFVVYGQALISAGTPQAQRTFLGALEARTSEPIVPQKLIAELIGLEHPDSATIQSIRRLGTDRAHPLLASSSILILGRFAGKVAASSPKLAAMLINGLGADLLATKDPDRQRLYIGALGNAGQVSCVPYVRRFLSSSNVKVRADAVASLRFVMSGKVDALLREHLMRDKSDDVREAAVFAIGFRAYNDENFGALVLALRGDTSDRVRRSALSTLWTQRDTQPAIVTVVDEVSRKDPSKDIRKTASDLLNIDRGRG